MQPRPSTVIEAPEEPRPAKRDIPVHEDEHDLAGGLAFSFEAEA